MSLSLDGFSIDQRVLGQLNPLVSPPAWQGLQSKHSSVCDGQEIELSLDGCRSECTTLGRLSQQLCVLIPLMGLLIRHEAPSAETFSPGGGPCLRADTNSIALDHPGQNTRW